VSTAPRNVRERRGWRRYTLPAGCLLAALAAAAWQRERGIVQQTAREQTPTAVHGILRSLRGPLAERRIGRLVPDSLTPEECRPVLEEILADPGHPSFRQAVLLAVHMGLTDLAPALREAMPGAADADRPLLVCSLDRCERLTDAELAELFAADSTKAAITALEIAGSRAEPPLDLIVDQLVVGDRAVRAAALKALPARFPAAVGERIVAVSRHLGPEMAIEAILALARSEASPVVDEYLYRRLDEGDHGCNAVLQVLGQRREPLQQPNRILGIAKDPGQSVRARARALLCLEQTGAWASIEQLEAGWQRHPVLDYFVARTLLLAGRRDSFRMLLDLVRAEEVDREIDEAAMVAEARVGARQILAQFAGTSAAADPATWEAWIATQPAILAVALPQSLVQLGR
jgi:hypothetical protein